jgi:hypothetical protein
MKDVEPDRHSSASVLRLLDNRLTTWTQALHEAIRLTPGESRYRRLSASFLLEASHSENPNCFTGTVVVCQNRWQPLTNGPRNL